MLIPHMRIRSAGTLNDDLLGIIQANSRNPVEVMGDIRSLLSCNDAGVARFADMLDEFGLDSLDDLSRHIIESSVTAMRQAIHSVPDGVYSAQMTIDGYEKPIALEARLTVDKETIHLD